MFDVQSGALLGQIKVGDKPIVWMSIGYSVIVADGVIYALHPNPSILEPETLYAFSVESGMQLWEYRVAEGIRSSFSVVDGVLYFTSEGGNLYALNGKSGQLLLKYELDQSHGWQNYSNPTVVADLIYVNVGSTLYAISISGTRPTPSDLDAQVAIAR